jgi:hypothetical protein
MSYLMRTGGCFCGKTQYETTNCSIELTDKAQSASELPLMERTPGE